MVKKTSKKRKLPEKSVSGSVLNIAFDSTIDSLDPQKAVNASSFEMIGNCIDGLMQMADDGSVQKAICKEEIVSSDGLKHTFKLRDDVFWSNGELVTAHDFVYGWERAVDPATQSEYAFMMRDIAQVKNAGAIMAGQMDKNQLGVRAVDDYTFEVQLRVPVSFFNQLLYFCTFYPANQKFIEKVGENYATTPENFLCNGAFILTEYEPQGKGITFIKNTAYYDADKVSLAGLNYKIVADGAEALQKFKNGEVDLAEVAGSQISQVKDSPEFKSVASGFLYYLTFNLDNPYFKSKNLRLALSLAIDRNEVVDNLGDGSQAAYSAVPRGYAFDSNGQDFTPDGVEFPETCDYDPERAREYFRMAQSELGQREFSFSLLVAEIEAQLTTAKTIKEQIETLLPEIHIELNVVSKKERRKLMVAHKFEVGLTNWGPDYADPMTYLSMWVTGNDNNMGNYVNPKYNAIIASCSDGELCTKPAERWKAMKDGEKMVMDDVVISPVYQKCNADLIKTNVRGIAFHAVAINRIYKHTSK
ncbi:peptide ABC transporter substrate-binding protein [Treponema zioleckii]|uniref:peptide ABC transporter substrate-binding protein n=1 Tax=Treponema zioleckii TaxID=331680 RepID=UPI00168B8EBA|nr:peptide ABC transporter substrate-binding protein [Treponema zioleckii]